MSDDEKILALLQEAQELETQGAKSEAVEKAAQAADLLSNCYRGFVVGLCRSRLSRYLGREAATEIAEDIAHDILLYVFRQYMRQWDRDTNIRVRLIQLARSRTIDFLKGQQRQKTLVQRFRDVIGGHAVIVQRAYEEVDVQYRALEQLRPDEKEILYLRYDEGTSIEDIATSLGIDVRSVERRIRRIREKLRGLLKNLEEGS